MCVRRTINKVLIHHINSVKQIHGAGMCLLLAYSQEQRREVEKLLASTDEADGDFSIKDLKGRKLKNFLNTRSGEDFFSRKSTYLSDILVNISLDPRTN